MGLGPLCPGKASRDGGYAWKALCARGRHPNRLRSAIVVGTHAVVGLFGSDMQTIRSTAEREESSPQSTDQAVVAQP
eukprot:8131303-Pyramimonas_sp.AAC.1